MLLNDADKVYLGGGLASAVYAGAVKVWPYVFVNSEASTLVAAMTVPPTAERRKQIDTFIGALKAAGVWAKLDVLYVMAAHDSQAANLNWKSPSTLALVPQNAPVFTANQGYQGNGTSANLQLPYNPTTFPSPQYTQDDACIGLYIRSQSTINGMLDFLLGGARLQKQGTGVNYQGRINDSVSASMSAGAPTPGHWAIKRTGATARSMWKNGAVAQSDAQASGAVINAVGSILSAGGSSAWSDGQISCAYVGAGSTDIAALNTALMTYLQAVGAV
jgi:hypothetical protein